MLYAKNAKRNWKNKLFGHIFTIGGILIGGGPAPSPLGYAYAGAEEISRHCPVML